MSLKISHPIIKILEFLRTKVTVGKFLSGSNLKKNINMSLGECYISSFFSVTAEPDYSGTQ